MEKIRVSWLIIFSTALIAYLAVARPALATPTIEGQKGILRILSADSGEKGNFSFNLHGEMFSQKDLLEGEPGEYSQQLGRTGLDYVFTDYLEVSTSMMAKSNEIDGEVYSTVGDTDLGFKLKYEISPFIKVGMNTFIRIMSKLFEQGIAGGATSYGFRGLGSLDFTELDSEFPLRVHLNAGYFIDNSKELLGDRVGISLSKQFAYNIRAGNVLLLGFGLEVPLRDESLIPFLEYSSEMAGEEDDLAFSRITPGMRYRFLDSFAVDFAIDVGISEHTPAWNIVTGISYLYSASRPTVVYVPSLRPAELARLSQKPTEPEPAKRPQVARTRTPRKAPQVAKPEPTPAPKPKPVAVAAPPPKPKAPAGPKKPLKDLKISVLNGCGTPGLAEKVAKALLVAGLNVSKVGNAKSFDYNVTTVVYLTGYDSEARTIGSKFGTNQRFSSIDSIEGGEEVSVIVGCDMR
ncbi:MAG: LytR C-terminal domain-containing protein [Deltaproteobacteria bacterium]|nr:MAG: LytR C-terminal domain-containing protein [Deltaproteobacteria bacterium]